MKLAVILFLCLATISFGQDKITKMTEAKSGAYAVQQASLVYEDTGWKTSLIDKATGQETPLWVSGRPVEVHLSDDDQWLVIEDHTMRPSSFLLVFHIHEGKARLVYQSPHSSSDFRVFFRFKGWKTSSTGFFLKQEVAISESSQKPLVYNIRLSPKMVTIVPTAYEADSGYGQITEVKPDEK